MEKKIEVYLEELKKEEVFQQLIEVLCSIGNPYIIGGAVRDIAIDKTPKDLDIILESDILDLTPYMKYLPHIKNRFGGFKIILSNIVVDLWLMHDHYPFKQNWYSPSIQNFLYTPVFNIDAIYYDIKKRELYIDNFIEAFRTRELSLQLRGELLEQLPFVEINISKALVSIDKYKLHFSPPLYDYIQRWVEHTPNAYYILESIQIKNYGKVIINEEGMKKKLIL